MKSNLALASHRLVFIATLILANMQPLRIVVNTLGGIGVPSMIINGSLVAWWFR